METINLAEAQWQLKAVDESVTVPATIPGEVHLALMKAGLIPDPFVGDNELLVHWVAENDWVFEGKIRLSDDFLKHERVVLSFDGLDTLSQVTLNDESLGKTNNAFRFYSWDVKPYLHEGINQLRVLFHSPVKYITSRQMAAPLISPDQSIPGGPYLRKAPYQWGWDWAPKLPPIGIWKDASLEGFDCAKLATVHLSQDHLFSGTVKVIAEVSVSQWSEVPLQVCLTLQDPLGKKFATTCKVLEHSAKALIEIPDPVLWWPNGYGDQVLYHAQITLRTEDEKILNQRSYQIGLRKIACQQTKDDYGESFTFVVNDIPIFAKGANWVPADSFPTRISKNKLKKLLGDAACAHHNMIRVWGGGFYESEEFYDLCDRFGILVWQDFIFSCSVYPLDDPDFVANVRQEIKDNVSRIRHHASLALWCGNNEMDLGWEAWGWHEGDMQPYRESYRSFFYDTLPAWLKELDPDTPYWFSSPSSGTPFENANSDAAGDAHYWDVWHGAKPFNTYRNQFPRFMSEFGFQSLPPLRTIQAFANEDHWNLTDYIMEHHQRSPFGSALMMGLMTQHFMIPADFPSLVYLTMVLQSEGIRYGVEHWRRNRHRVSGTLYWQLNDCWPVASWSSLDYEGRWKALHYACRKFYRPLLLSIDESQERGEMNVHLTSDLTTEWVGEVRWRWLQLDGKVLDSGQMPVQSAPLSSQLIFQKVFHQLKMDEKRDTIFTAQLIQDEKVLTTQVATFLPNKHLCLADPQLKVYIHDVDENTVMIELKAVSLARFVELSLDDADVVFSDNYFDVIPGEAVRISFQKPEGWSIDDIGQSLTVFSLYDSFSSNF